MDKNNLAINGDLYQIDVDCEAGGVGFDDNCVCAFDKDNEIVAIDVKTNKIVNHIPSLLLEGPEYIHCIAKEWWPHINEYMEYMGNVDARPHIKRLEISQGFTEIWTGAFKGWSALELVILPPSITTVQKNAFAECPNLRTILQYGNELNWLYDWEKSQELTAEEWAAVLAIHPLEILEKVGDRMGLWSKLNPHGWSRLLRFQPQYLSKCNCLHRFNGYDWVYLLQKRPKFENECNKHDGWRKIDFAILSSGECFMQYEDKIHGKIIDYNGVERDIARIVHGSESERTGDEIFGTDDSAARIFGTDGEEIISNEKLVSCGRWAELLIEQPMFSSKCDEYNGWITLDGLDWVLLLQSRPQFIEKCNDFNGWDLIFKDQNRNRIIICHEEYEDNGAFSCSHEDKGYEDAFKDVVYKYSLEDTIDEEADSDEFHYHGGEFDSYGKDLYYENSFLRQRCVDGKRDGFSGLVRFYPDFIKRFQHRLSHRFFVCYLKSIPKYAANEYERLQLWNSLDKNDWLEIFRHTYKKNTWEHIVSKMSDNDFKRKVLEWTSDYERDKFRDPHPDV